MLADAANLTTVATVPPCPSPACLGRWSRSDLGQARERGRRLRRQPEGVRPARPMPGRRAGNAYAACLGRWSRSDLGEAREEREAAPAAGRGEARKTHALSKGG